MAEYTVVKTDVSAVVIEDGDIDATYPMILGGQFEYRYKRAIASLIGSNEQAIKDRIDEYARGPFSYLSWHHSHTTTTVGNIIIVSLLSTAFVSGDFDPRVDE